MEHDIYPELTEQGKKEAELILAKFKDRMKSICDETLGELYMDVVPYIESDSWNNFRNKIKDGMTFYANKPEHLDYDFKDIRERMLVEHRESLVKDINKDLLEENERLQERIDALIHRFRF
jgi:predicted HAD superfamily phosphohydrolase